MIDGCDLVASLDRCVLSRYFVGFLMFLVEASEKGGVIFGQARESEWIVGVDLVPKWGFKVPRHWSTSYSLQ